ncbi:hypothetical protein [Alloyangia pacifica]|uniref:hypothetical protein n=1 Tax=Alloyangia pacifica TaxID=311180 RepID=UPI001CD201AE|nr:hypothetical protein [Alloyangia pacifica]MCA0996842.1 hypothetical protein [Alloyangia pacifica]
MAGQQTGAIIRNSAYVTKSRRWGEHQLMHLNRLSMRKGAPQADPDPLPDINISASPKVSTVVMHSQNHRFALEGRYQRFFQIVDEIVEEIQTHRWEATGETKKQLRGDRLNKLRASVETLTRDSLGLVYQRVQKGEASIHLDGNWYSSSASPSELTRSIHIQRAYQGMLELGYLEQTKNGVYDRQGRKDGTVRSRLTRYQATDRLIGKFTEEEQEVLPVLVPPAREHAPIRVRIKKADGPDELFVAPDNSEVRRMTENLARINLVLASRWYDLQLPDQEMGELVARLMDDPEGAKSLSLDKRSLYRVFNDRELTTGGRFYGGWWQNVPKAYRRVLVVNGKHMVEIDYSNLHPVILYGETGAVPPEDCYLGIFDSATEARGGSALRSKVKSAFNAMLNAEKTLRQAPKGINFDEFDLSWKQVSDAILAAHEPIAHLFYSGAGKRLQRKDSDVAERVMLDFIERGIPILPVHDSFLVHDGHRELLADRMQAALYEVCGVATKLKAEEPNLSRIIARNATGEGDDRGKFGDPTNLDIVELLRHRDACDKRLDAFFDLKE